MLTPPIRYPLDKTGIRPENLVVGEPHELPNRLVRAIAPAYGAYFAESIIVRDLASGQQLTKGLHYKTAELLPFPTGAYGKEICGIILITDPSVSNNVEITYQALGGEYSTNSDAIVQLITNLQLDNRPVSFKDLTDLPSEGFTPAFHYHDIGDVYGFEYIVHAIERLRSAILIGDSASHQEIYDYIDSLLGNRVTTELVTTESGGSSYGFWRDRSTNYIRQWGYVEKMEPGKACMVYFPRLMSRLQNLTITPANIQETMAGAVGSYSAVNANIVQKTICSEGFGFITSGVGQGGFFWAAEGVSSAVDPTTKPEYKLVDWTEFNSNDVNNNGWGNGGLEESFGIYPLNGGLPPDPTNLIGTYGAIYYTDQMTDQTNIGSWAGSQTIGDDIWQRGDAERLPYKITELEVKNISNLVEVKVLVGRHTNNDPIYGEIRLAGNTPVPVHTGNWKYAEDLLDQDKVWVDYIHPDTNVAIRDWSNVVSVTVKPGVFKAVLFNGSEADQISTLVSFKFGSEHRGYMAIQGGIPAADEFNTYGGIIASQRVLEVPGSAAQIINNQVGSTLKRWDQSGYVNYPVTAFLTGTFSQSAVVTAEVGRDAGGVMRYVQFEVLRNTPVPTLNNGMVYAENLAGKKIRIERLGPVSGLVESMWGNVTSVTFNSVSGQYTLANAALAGTNSLMVATPEGNAVQALAAIQGQPIADELDTYGGVPGPVMPNLKPIAQMMANDPFWYAGQLEREQAYLKQRYAIDYAGTIKQLTIDTGDQYTQTSQAVGEITLTAAGAGSFVVPVGVDTIDLVAVGPGGDGVQFGGNVSGGGGGGLAFKNSISVTPGQVINYVIGSRATNTATQILGITANSGQKGIGDGSSTQANGGTATGGDVNFTGGKGQLSFGGNALGGSAATYTSDGVNGGNQGIGLTGTGSVGSYGKGGTSVYSGSPTQGENGAIRIIWGTNRSFPNNAATTAAAIGDAIYDTPGTYTFTVPVGVNALSYVGIGGGGSQYFSNASTAWAGGSGALVYGNNISVTPGDVVQIQVGQRGVFNSNTNQSQDGTFTRITINGVSATANPGKGATNGSVGVGGLPAGTYTAGFRGGNGTTGSSSNIRAGSSGKYDSDGIPGGSEGTGLFGLGSVGNYGKGDDVDWTSSTNSNSSTGAVRLMWGGSRTFPNTAASIADIRGDVVLTDAVGFWTVPPGVNYISMVCIGPGGQKRYAQADQGSGGGGGLAFKNNVPVVPGQQIYYAVGKVGTNTNTTMLGLLAERGGDAVAGVPGVGGNAQGGDVNFKGGNGFSDSSLDVINGGSAGGYTANGANASATTGGEGTGVYGTTGATGVYGRGAASGKWNTPTTSPLGGDGVIRLMWGTNRSYPSNATNAATGASVVVQHKLLAKMHGKTSLPVKTGGVVLAQNALGSLVFVDYPNPSTGEATRKWAEVTAVQDINYTGPLYVLNKGEADNNVTLVHSDKAGNYVGINGNLGGHPVVFDIEAWGGILSSSKLSDNGLIDGDNVSTGQAVWESITNARQAKTVADKVVVNVATASLVQLRVEVTGAAGSTTTPYTGTAKSEDFYLHRKTKLRTMDWPNITNAEDANGKYVLVDALISGSRVRRWCRVISVTALATTPNRFSQVNINTLAATSTLAGGKDATSGVFDGAYVAINNTTGDSYTDDFLEQAGGIEQSSVINTAGTVASAVVPATALLWRGSTDMAATTAGNQTRKSLWYPGGVTVTVNVNGTNRSIVLHPKTPVPIQGGSWVVATALAGQKVFVDATGAGGSRAWYTVTSAVLDTVARRYVQLRWDTWQTQSLMVGMSGAQTTTFMGVQGQSATPPVIYELADWGGVPGEVPMSLDGTVTAASISQGGTYLTGLSGVAILNKKHLMGNGSIVEFTVMISSSNTAITPYNESTRTATFRVHPKTKLNKSGSTAAGITADSLTTNSYVMVNCNNGSGGRSYRYCKVLSVNTINSSVPIYNFDLPSAVGICAVSSNINLAQKDYLSINDYGIGPDSYEDVMPSLYPYASISSSGTQAQGMNLGDSVLTRGDSAMVSSTITKLYKVYCFTRVDLEIGSGNNRLQFSLQQTTPVQIQNGSWVPAYSLAGQKVFVDRNGSRNWETVTNAVSWGGGLQGLAAIFNWDTINSVSYMAKAQAFDGSTNNYVSIYGKNAALPTPPITVPELSGVANPTCQEGSVNIIYQTGGHPATSVTGSADGVPVTNLPISVSPRLSMAGKHYNATATNSAGTSNTVNITLNPQPGPFTFPDPISTVYRNVGNTYSQTFSSASNPTVPVGSISASGLPPGMSISGATLSGTFTTPGTYNVTFTIYPAPDFTNIVSVTTHQQFVISA